MAQQHANHCHQNLTQVLFIFLVMSTSLSCTSARLLPRDYLSQNPIPEKEARHHVLPCHTDQTESNTKQQQQQQPEIMGFEASSSASTPRFGAAAAKYGPLLLNLLPKGSTKPPSGPSKGTNDLNN